MELDVAFVPQTLQGLDLHERAVVVLDVLRATTSIAAALWNGAREIRVFPTLDAARAAAGELPQGGRLLCGETRCLPPPGFDLGNSPGAFTAEAVSGRIVLLATTNGTRALVAAGQAGLLLAGSLVNASATAGALIANGRGAVTLLCSGTDGAFALEDTIGAGAVIAALRQREADVRLASDAAQAAVDVHAAAQQRGVYETFLVSRGGQNVLAAGLSEDLRFAARIDACPVVAVCDHGLVIRRAGGAGDVRQSG